MVDVIHAGKGRRIDVDGAPIDTSYSASTADPTIADVLSGSDGVFFRYRSDGSTTGHLAKNGRSFDFDLSCQPLPLDASLEPEINLP